jgi:hypothetical protein
MTTLVSPWPKYRQALVRALRANLVLEDSLPGDWNEGFVPQATKEKPVVFPHGTYSLAFGPPDYDWTGVVSVVGADVVVYSKDSGEAASLDQLVFDTLQDANLSVAGLTTLSCRRTGIISLTDVDSTGATIFVLGGTYVSRLAQSNPTLGSLSVTFDATIS